jgi:hypothetical protein
VPYRYVIIGIPNGMRRSSLREYTQSSQSGTATSHQSQQNGSSPSAGGGAPPTTGEKTRQVDTEPLLQVVVTTLLQQEEKSIEQVYLQGLQEGYAAGWAKAWQMIYPMDELVLGKDGTPIWVSS